MEANASTGRDAIRRRAMLLTANTVVFVALAAILDDAVRVLHAEVPRTVGLALATFGAALAGSAAAGHWLVYRTGRFEAAVRYWFWGYGMNVVMLANWGAVSLYLFDLAGWLGLPARADPWAQLVVVALSFTAFVVVLTRIMLRGRA